MADLGEGEFFLLDSESARRLIDDAVDAERKPEGPGRRPQRAAASPITQFVLDSNTTDPTTGYRSASVQRYNTTTKLWETLGTVWFADADKRYARLVGVNPADGKPVFMSIGVSGADSCCPGYLGGKPLGGGITLSGKNCCCCTTTNPPGGGSGGSNCYWCMNGGGTWTDSAGQTWVWSANMLGPVWCGPGPEPINGPAPGPNPWGGITLQWIRGPATAADNWQTGPCFMWFPQSPGIAGGGSGGIAGVSGGGSITGITPGGGPIGILPILPRPGGFPTYPSPPNILPIPGGDGGGVSLPYPPTPSPGGNLLWRNSNPPRPVFATPLGGGPLGGGGSAFIFPSEGGTGVATVPAAGNFLVSNGTTYVTTPPGQTVSPTISASQNDYSFGGITATNGDNVVVLQSSGVGPWDITGFSIGQVDRTRLTIIKTASAPNVVLKHNNAGSAAANRMRLGNAAADITLTGDKTVSFIYDGNQLNWKMTANSN